MGSFRPRSNSVKMTFRGCFCLLRQMRPYMGSAINQRMGYKSQYNIENLYPKSSLEAIATPLLKHTKAGDGEKFDGFIPIDKLDIKYSRSSGAGGQNVNKVNTKVEIRFHVESADWLSSDAKERIRDTENTRITNDGYLIVRSEKTRKQLLNQADCMEKIREIVRRAEKEPFVPSEEDLAVKAQRLEKARRGMLREKRNRSYIKQLRAT